MLTDDSAVDELLRILQTNRRETNRIAEILFRQFTGPFTNYGRKEGLTQEEAEDARQLTFTKIMKNLEDYWGSSATAWMWDIHKNTIVDALRRRGTVTRHTFPLELDDPPALATESDPHTVIEREETQSSTPAARDYVIRCLVWSVEQLAPTERTELKKIPGRRGGLSRERKAARDRFNLAYRACAEREDDITDFLQERRGE